MVNLQTPDLGEKIAGLKTEMSATCRLASCYELVGSGGSNVEDSR